MTNPSVVYVSFSLLIAAFRGFVQGMVRALDGPGMMIIAFLDSSFLSLPEVNDLLIVGLSIGKTWPRIAYYVLLTAFGSVCGSFLLSLVGRRGGSLLKGKKPAPETVAWVKRLYARYGVLTLLIPSILPPPCPFKIFVISAGAFGIRWPAFLAAVVFGRTIRYSIWGILAFHYGAAVSRYMETNLPGIGLSLLGLLLFALGIVFTVNLLRARHGRSKDGQNPRLNPE